MGGYGEGLCNNRCEKLCKTCVGGEASVDSDAFGDGVRTVLGNRFDDFACAVADSFEGGIGDVLGRG